MKMKVLSRRIAVFFVLAAAPGQNGATDAAEPGGDSSRPTADARMECDEPCDDMVADYQVFIREDPRGGGLRVLEIRKAGATVFKGPPGFWDLLDDVTGLTGDDRKYLAASYFSLGAHCCTTFFLFELGKRFSVVESIDTGNSEVEFTDLDGDGRPELSFWDDNFAWWNYSSFAQTPTPRVVLALRDGRYRMALEHMRRTHAAAARRWCEKVLKFGGGEREKALCAKPDAAPALPAIARAIRDDAGWQGRRPPSVMWDFLLHLVYSGNAADAWRILEAVWPDNADGLVGFKIKFLDRLSGSPYFEDLKRLNPSGL